MAFLMKESYWLRTLPAASLLIFHKIVFGIILFLQAIFFKKWFLCFNSKSFSPLLIQSAHFHQVLYSWGFGQRFTPVSVSCINSIKQLGLFWKLLEQRRQLVDSSFCIANGLLFMAFLHPTQKWRVLKRPAGFPPLQQHTKHNVKSF